MELTLSISNCVVFILLSILHIYWVCGGNFGLDAAVPTDSNGRKIFKPTKVGTLAVGIGLAIFAWVNLNFVGVLDAGIAPVYLKYGVIAIAIIFALRFMGDFRYVGITKSFKKSKFSVRDSYFYSPLCFLISLSHWALLF